MSLIADALQPHTVEGLLSLRATLSDLTVSDLLVAPGAAYDLDFDDIAESFSADFRDSLLIVPSIGADANRFASAAFQSVAPVVDEIQDKDKLAWSIVKLYYAAFYAGHSLIRLLGESCSYLDRTHINKVAAVGAAIGKAPAFRIERGVYRCQTNAAATAIRCSKVSGPLGGAHEAFWSMFRSCLKTWNQQILRGPLVAAEAQRVFVQFEALDRVLGLTGAGIAGNLSTIRNALQYRHTMGVWFPVKVKKADRQRLGRIVRQWQSDPMTIPLSGAHKSPLDQFATACVLIIATCRSLLLRIAARSSAGDKCFICYGPVSFLRAAGLDVS